jgi:hypothetical protein
MTSGGSGANETAGLVGSGIAVSGTVVSIRGDFAGLRGGHRAGLCSSSASVRTTCLDCPGEGSAMRRELLLSEREREVEDEDEPEEELEETGFEAGGVAVLPGSNAGTGPSCSGGSVVDGGTGGGGAGAPPHPLEEAPPPIDPELAP